MKSLKEINKEKSKYQEEKYKDWVKAGGRGVFVWATGTGKTRLATHLAIPRMNLKQPNFVTKVVLPREFLRDGWTKRGGYIQKEGLRNVEGWVVNSYVTMRHVCDLLVLDECHRYSNEDAKLFSRVLELTRCRFVLALTAKLTPEQEQFFANNGIPVIDYLPIYEAEKRGFVSPYKVYNYPVELTEDDREKAAELESEFSYYADKLGSRVAFQLSDDIVKDRLYPRYDKEIQQWREPVCAQVARERGWQGISLQHAVRNYMDRCNAPQGQKGSISIWEDDRDNHDFTPTKTYLYGINYKKAMRHRMDFLHSARNKIDAVIEILKKFNKKAIVFSQRAEFADLITDKLGDTCASYHSKLESRPLKDEHGNFITYKSGKKKGEPKIFGVTTLRKMILQDFIDNKIKTISTVVTLDEGLDVPDVSLGIIASASGKTLQNTQRIGRIVRAEDGKSAIIINLFIKDTQDEVWLRNRQKEDKPAIWIESLDQLDDSYTEIQFEDDMNDDEVL